MTKTPDPTSTPASAYQFTEDSNLQTICADCARNLYMHIDGRGATTAVSDTADAGDHGAWFPIKPLTATELDFNQGCDSCGDFWDGTEFRADGAGFVSA